MKLNTTKLMIAAFALCGTCFLSCEKEESSKPEPEPEPTTPTAPIKFDSISVGSFEVDFYYTSKDRLFDAFIYISKDSLKLDNNEDIEFCEGRGDLYENIGKSFGYYFNTLAPNTKYYYRVRTYNPNYSDKYYYDSIRTFTTKDASLVTCESTEPTANKVCLYGTKLTYTTITDNYTPSIDIYYSTRKTQLSADSIAKAEKITINSYEPNTAVSDTVAITRLKELTQYYGRAVVSAKGNLLCMGEIVPLGTSFKKYEVSPVDLGLSVLWADMNVGATSEEEEGDVFAFGEIKQGEYLYQLDKNNIFYWPYNDSLYKCAINDSIINISGNRKHDAATANLGEPWRIPTVKEMQELIDMCEWKIIKIYGITGYKIIGPNGNSIFLPYYYYGYWTSEADYNYNNSSSYHLYTYETCWIRAVSITDGFKVSAIRPVCSK